MNNDLLIQSPRTPQKIFLQGGFWNPITPNTRFHKHSYTEIHLVHNGCAQIAVDDKMIPLKENHLLLIPKQSLHCCMEQDATTLHTAFQIDLPADKIEFCSLPSSVVDEFFRLILSNPKSIRFPIIYSFISLFCSYLRSDFQTVADPIEDDAFLIREFFSHHYAENVTLSDLALQLHRSERQCERLVRMHTGHSFREELIRTRIEVANHLSKSTDWSLNQISEYVGYRSYAGFWKAMKKHE